MKYADIQPLMIKLTSSITKIRGAYVEWAKRNGINYYELLVFFTLQDSGYCTQKLICERYMISKQSINNVVLSLRQRGYIDLVSGESHKEKRIVLTDEGRRYAEKILNPMNEMELATCKQLGAERLAVMTETAEEYGAILHRVFKIDPDAE